MKWRDHAHSDINKYALKLVNCTRRMTFTVEQEFITLSFSDMHIDRYCLLMWSVSLRKNKFQAKWRHFDWFSKRMYRTVNCYLFLYKIENCVYEWKCVTVVECIFVYCCGAWKVWCSRFFVCSFCCYVCPSFWFGVWIPKRNSSK